MCVHQTSVTLLQHSLENTIPDFMKNTHRRAFVASVQRERVALKSPQPPPPPNSLVLKYKKVPTITSYTPYMHPGCLDKTEYSIIRNFRPWRWRGGGGGKKTFLPTQLLHNIKPQCHCHGISSYVPPPPHFKPILNHVYKNNRSPKIF